MVSRTSRFVSIAPLISLAITFPTARFSAGTPAQRRACEFRDAAHPDRMGTEKGRGSLCGGHHTLFGELE